MQLTRRGLPSVAASVASDWRRMAERVEFAPLLRVKNEEVKGFSLPQDPPDSLKVVGRDTYRARGIRRAPENAPTDDRSAQPAVRWNSRSLTAELPTQGKDESASHVDFKAISGSTRAALRAGT